MKSGEKRLTQQQILVISFVFAIIMMYLVIILPSKIREGYPSIIGNDAAADSSTNEPSAGLPTNPSGEEFEISPSEAVESNDPSQQVFPIPIIGTSGVNLPSDFKVGPWHDNNCDFNLLQKNVNIIGVEIHGGTSPFTFSFWQSGEKIVNFVITPREGQARFPEAVKVERDSYVHIIITFQSVNGISEWSDDLLYSSNMLCLEP